MVDNPAANGQPPGGPFSFRSDRLALDYCATRMFRGRADGGLELFDRPGALAAWLAQSGLLPAPPACASAEVDRAVVLREAVYRLCLARIRGAPLPPDDAATVNGVAAGPPVGLALDAAGRVVRQGDATRALASIARDAVELLGGGEASRLRQCARDGCTRLFVDRSRAGRRVWCGMNACGNRVKAVAYRRRRAAGRAP